MKEARTTRAFSILRLASQLSWARPFAGGADTLRLEKINNFACIE